MKGIDRLPAKVIEEISELKKDVRKVRDEDNKCIAESVKSRLPNDRLKKSMALIFIKEHLEMLSV